MGFVHYNNTVEEQVAHVQRVKRHQHGYIASPLVLLATDPIAKIDQLKVRASVCRLCASTAGLCALQPLSTHLHETLFSAVVLLLPCSGYASSITGLPSCPVV